MTTNISPERIERAAKAFARRIPVAKDYSDFKSAIRAALLADAPKIAEAERRGKLEGLREASTLVRELERACWASVSDPRLPTFYSHYADAIDARIAEIESSVNSSDPT